MTINGGVDKIPSILHLSRRMNMGPPISTIFRSSSSIFSCKSDLHDLKAFCGIVSVESTDNRINPYF